MIYAAILKKVVRCVFCEEIKRQMDSQQGITVDEALPYLEITATDEELITMAKKAIVRQTLRNAGGWSVRIDESNGRKAYKSESQMSISELEQVRHLQIITEARAQKVGDMITEMIDAIRRKWKESRQQRMFIHEDEAALQEMQDAMNS